MDVENLWFHEDRLQIVDSPWASHIPVELPPGETSAGQLCQDSDEAAFAMLNRATAQLQQNRPPGVKRGNSATEVYFRKRIKLN